ncbi:hypothetical protein FSP39_022962 [Pinctada imbricata]|uniref:Reverse transcriptase domain-containing protein n=1 Tax=Pinctada imbricata TaxID=66713 RepID=A0AA88XVX9_PINIB|nr:hypothetical protein FSP39_022962 [Pinctada imbricata]
MEDKCGDTIKIDAYHQHFGRIKQTRLSKYRPNTQCVVQVKTAVGRRFVVVFRDIDIEYEPTCDDDYLQIFDGNTTSSPILEGLKKKLCGVKKPPGYYTSSSNEITFLFQSDVWSNEDGFEVLLTTFHEGPCGEEEFRCTNGRCINERLTCDGMNNCGDHSDECNLSPSVVLGIVSSVILITILGIGIILYIRRYGKRKSREKNKKMDSSVTCNNLAEIYNNRTRSALDIHAPLQMKDINITPNTRWYSTKLLHAKREKRKAERVWSNSNLEVHRSIFEEKCSIYTKLLHSSKKEYYTSKVKECGNDSKQLYAVANSVLGKNKEIELSSCANDLELANKFGEFFHAKIQTIRTNLEDLLEQNNSQSDALRADLQFTGNILQEFHPASDQEVMKLIQKSPSKSCCLDPIPRNILKDSVQHFLPIIIQIVNLSLDRSEFPIIFKQAVVKPLLKKPSLDKENLKNYRPVSNLPFISKIVEKVVACRIEDHLMSNCLHDPLQSAYRAFHSTETALLKVHHDVVVALDKGLCSVLIMLDLSAAFDVIDHGILFRRLEHSYGICGSALQWMKSYLDQRSQTIAIGSSFSESKELTIGVPQGSVLGPKIYCMFSKPISDICLRHSMRYHCYADDTQIYLVIEPLKNLDDITSRLTVCLNDIRDWMNVNLLKLNEDKTELMVFAPKNKIDEIRDFKLTFGDNIIYDAQFIKNLGAHFDKTLSMEKQCNQISKSCYFHLRNIGRIRHLLPEELCKTLINSLVTSRLDYGNALLFGVNKFLIEKLQRVQNAAARIVSRVRSKQEHISPVLQELHWLPVVYRIEFKVLVYVYKALHGLSPSYLTELVSFYRPTRVLRSESASLLPVPIVRTKTYGERRFDKSAATLWNNLPLTLRNCDSLSSFRKQLKIYLFKKAYL